MTLGSAEVLAIAMAPSSGALRASVSLDGDQLRAQVHLVQESVALTPIVRRELAQWRLDAALSDALDELSSLDTAVTVSGTLAAPRFELHSNVGLVVGEAFSGALNAAVAAHSDRLLGESQRYIDEQVAKVDRLAEERTVALVKELRLPSEKLQQLTKSVSPSQGMTLEELGRSLPVNSLFR